jgi:mRNA-degrading endonuclease toxin of MazEF toxin-antitoxin module
VTPTPGEIWTADLSDEVRRPVLVVSDRRLHQSARRAFVAPVVSERPSRHPWFVDIGDGRCIALQHLRSVHVDRLLAVDHRLDVVAFGRIRVALRQLVAG